MALNNRLQGSMKNSDIDMAVKAQLDRDVVSGAIGILRAGII